MSVVMLTYSLISVLFSFRDLIFWFLERPCAHVCSEVKAQRKYRESHAVGPTRPLGCDVHSFLQMALLFCSS